LVYSIGIATHRDNFVYDFNKAALFRRISQFRDLSISDDIIRQTYDLNNTRDWKLSINRIALATLDNWQDHFQQCHYRPFDSRILYYHPYLIELPRFKVMQHMLNTNVGLTLGRQGQVVGKDQVWNLAFISNKLIDVNLYYRGGANLMPLYLFKENQELSLFEHNKRNKQTNIKPQIMLKLINEYGDSLTPESVFYYIYAVLYSNIFRISYSDYLNHDYPHIPFTKNQVLFVHAASLGQRLADLHLLRSDELDMPTVKYQGHGDDHIIIKPTYVESEQSILATIFTSPPPLPRPSKSRQKSMKFILK
jgi:predicted helicase